MGDGRQAQPARGILAAAAQGRDQSIGKAQLLRFLQALVDLADGPDLSTQADLAENHRAGGRRTGQPRGDQRRRHRQIGRRLADSQAAGDVQIDIVAAEAKTAAGLQHGQDHGQPAGVPADHRAARRAGAGGGDQGLDLDQQRPRAFQAGEDRGAADLAVAVGQEQGRGIGEPPPGPASVISKTPISSVGPKRFFTARRMRK